SDTKWYIVLPQEPDDLHPEGTPEMVLSRAAAVENGHVAHTTNVVAVAEVAVGAVAVIVVT
ncbi:hypothetical protein, partial [Streptomyces alanosinicus]|uniref:hypothetical protein n=1 Tax=Streptomyces alanosinicus TaxID=68171 RepID=UPI0016753D25